MIYTRIINTNILTWFSKDR